MLKNFKLKMSQGEPLKCIAIGDSLTEGWMVRKGYIDFLREMIPKKYPDANITIINRGIPGDTAKGGQFRLRQDVLENNPDLVIIQFALNDAFLGYSPSGFRESIMEMIEEIQNNTYAEILLLTSVPIYDESLNKVAIAFYDILIEIASKMDVPIVKVHDYWMAKVKNGLSFNTLVQGDGVHPTVEGYRIMAESIMEIL